MMTFLQQHVQTEEYLKKIERDNEGAEHKM